MHEIDQTRVARSAVFTWTFFEGVELVGVKGWQL